MEHNYWKSLEELYNTPEFLETQGKEFLSRPIDLDDDDQNGVTRRDFLKLMGASLLMAGAAGCSRRPIEKIVPYLNKPEELTVGVPLWYSSTCGECPANCGILVKTREGRPIKLEGNPDHPMNQGGLCARGQASLLNLYDPDRLQAPVKKDGEAWKALSWKEIALDFETIFKEIKEKKGKIRFVTGHIGSPSTQKLIDQFLAQFENAKHVSFEPLSLESVVEAQKESYGQAVLPKYRFDKAQYILSFGADFLDTWLSPVEFTKQFSKSRDLSNGTASQGTMSRFVAFESVPTATGTNADLHIPIRRGDELFVALGLAHEIISKQGLSLPSSIVSYNLETVSKETGIAENVLRSIAKDLWGNRGKSLVVGGGYNSDNNSAKDLNIAVNFLNSILGNDGITVEAQSNQSLQSSGSYKEMRALFDEMRRGEIALLMVANVNLAYIFPKEFDEALQKVPLVVRLAERVDETALISGWILPLHHYLESWGDAQPQTGLYSLFQPSIAPLYDTKHLQDILLGWISGETRDWHQYLKDFWQGKISWDFALRRGVIDLRSGTGGHSPRNFNTSALQRFAPYPHKEPMHDLQVVAYPTISHFDGRSGNNSWLKELPDPVSKITWRNYLSVSPILAKEKGYEEGDVVELTVKDSGTSVELPVHIQPGLHPANLAVGLGWGHTHFGKVADGVGQNGFEFSFSHTAEIKKTGKWLKFAITQGHHSMEGRPILKETTLNEYQKNPAAGNENPAHLPTMWSEHKYEGYRWGMAIDLNSCTGCSACVIACQAENNIPVVGEKQVKKGREMHWIRIDRYYAGEEENPEALHQPMLCQHCENAPCETVCPVVATLHNEEGLNLQVYNRCVGTRYCSNNCPYKVRRFNWFEYLRGLETPLAMALNPDVTVREKGVMEKCTFCIQRITEAKDTAKDYGRKVVDGELMTACQQSCPANAIVFGNINDPESKVSKLAKDPRGYHVLADLNTRPSITYLTKVRNKESI